MFNKVVAYFITEITSIEAKQNAIEFLQSWYYLQLLEHMNEEEAKTMITLMDTKTILDIFTKHIEQQMDNKELPLQKTEEAIRNIVKETMNK